jgi:hypothetical protein
MEDHMAAGVASAALVIGFLAGLLAFKVKSRWCPQCGSPTYPVVPEHRDKGFSAYPPK